MLRRFAHNEGILYNATMLTYVCILAFLMIGYMWLRGIVLRQERARFARRRRWRAWILDQLTEEPPESGDYDRAEH